jgi:hypothetical protein
MNNPINKWTNEIDSFQIKKYKWITNTWTHVQNLGYNVNTNQSYTKRVSRTSQELTAPVYIPTTTWHRRAPTPPDTSSKPA